MSRISLSFAFLGLLLAAPAVQAAAVRGTLQAAPHAAALIPAQWPGYGEPPGPGYGREGDGRREHCWHLRERLREIRYRIEAAPYWERDRLGYRMHEVREQLRQECRGFWRED